MVFTNMNVNNLKCFISLLLVFASYFLFPTASQAQVARPLDAQEMTWLKSLTDLQKKYVLFHLDRLQDPKGKQKSAWY